MLLGCSTAGSARTGLDGMPRERRAVAPAAGSPATWSRRRCPGPRPPRSPWRRPPCRPSTRPRQSWSRGSSSSGGECQLKAPPSRDPKPVAAARSKSARPSASRTGSMARPAGVAVRDGRAGPRRVAEGRRTIQSWSPSRTKPWPATARSAHGSDTDARRWTGQPLREDGRRGVRAGRRWRGRRSAAPRPASATARPATRSGSPGRAGGHRASRRGWRREAATRNASSPAGGGRARGHQPLRLRAAASLASREILPHVPGIRRLRAAASVAWATRPSSRCSLRRAAKPVLASGRPPRWRHAPRSPAPPRGQQSRKRHSAASASMSAKARSRPSSASDELQRAHARGVDEQPAAGQLEQLPCGGRVTAARVVLANVADELALRRPAARW